MSGITRGEQKALDEIIGALGRIEVQLTRIADKMPGDDVPRRPPPRLDGKGRA